MCVRPGSRGLIHIRRGTNRGRDKKEEEEEEEVAEENQIVITLCVSVWRKGLISSSIHCSPLALPSIPPVPLLGRFSISIPLIQAKRVSIPISFLKPPPPLLLLHSCPKLSHFFDRGLGPTNDCDDPQRRSLLHVDSRARNRKRKLQMKFHRGRLSRLPPLLLVLVAPLRCARSGKLRM